MRQLHTYVGDFRLVTATIEQHFRVLDRRQFLVSTDSLQAKAYTSTPHTLASKAQSLANSGHPRFIVDYYLETASGILAESCQANKPARTDCLGITFAAGLIMEAIALITTLSTMLVRTYDSVSEDCEHLSL